MHKRARNTAALLLYKELAQESMSAVQVSCVSRPVQVSLSVCQRYFSGLMSTMDLRNPSTCMSYIHIVTNV